jgi:hypothetical protein
MFESFCVCRSRFTGRPHVEKVLPNVEKGPEKLTEKYPERPSFKVNYIAHIACVVVVTATVVFKYNNT